jgi:hypothetical protein
MDELVRIVGEEAIDFCPRLDSYKLPIEAWNKWMNYMKSVHKAC